MNNIIFLEPTFRHRIWGGVKLKTEWNYSVEGDDIGECWAISAHCDGDCAVKNPEYNGIHLSELYDMNPELFSSKECGEQFPLLVKIIDARDDLSIQVHPDDDYAIEHENGSLGKTECWYVLDADEGSYIIAGHNAQTKEELTQKINEGKWEELIRKVPVKKGDFLQINPGTLHAIKGGISVLETQQNSNVTYRVYDYDRLFEGKKRNLHLRQALDVINVPDNLPSGKISNFADVGKDQMVELSDTKYYTIYKTDVKEGYTFELTENFYIMSVIDGAGTINGINIKKGDHFIVLNKEKEVTFSGEMSIIVSTAK